MLNSEAADGLSGLLEWSEPVIYDRLLMAYRSRLGDKARSGSWRGCIAVFGAP
jgi:hypothetical protein